MADSEASASILSFDLAIKLEMKILDKGNATLKDSSNKHMDVSGRGEVTVQEEYGYPYNIQVLVSKDLGKEEMVVGLEDLKALGILYKDFPKTMPDRRRWGMEAREKRYNSIRGDQRGKQMEFKEELERARGVLLYLEEMYKQVDEKITNFDSFPKKIQTDLKKYIAVFDTKLRKSMSVPPVNLNVVEGSAPRACYSCGPTTLH